jgi:hypothetical protein
LAFVVAGTAANTQTAYIDNIAVDNVVPVPEPSASMLIVIGTLAMAAARWSRK